MADLNCIYIDWFVLILNTSSINGYLFGNCIFSDYYVSLSTKWSRHIRVNEKYTVVIRRWRGNECRRFDGVADSGTYCKRVGVLLAMMKSIYFPYVRFRPFS